MEVSTCFGASFSYLLTPQGENVGVNFIRRHSQLLGDIGAFAVEALVQAFRGARPSNRHWNGIDFGRAYIVTIFKKKHKRKNNTA